MEEVTPYAPNPSSPLIAGLIKHLLRVLGCYRRRVIHLNTTPLLFHAIVEWQFPTTFLLRCA